MWGDLPRAERSRLLATSVLQARFAGLPSTMEAALRMLDANLNRAREGLRVVEDVARFALDDAATSREAKRIRHELAAAMTQLGVPDQALLDARDTPGDVGISHSGASDQRRDQLSTLAHANAGRVAEALRVIEECCKLLGKSDVAHRVESLRYATYTLHQQVAGRLTRSPRQYRLCVLLTERLCSKPWDDVAAQAIAGGADCLQLREKDLPDAELLRRARRLVSLASGCAVFINDRPDIALLAQATGVHLGQTDMPLADARALAGSRLLIGVSTENLDQARAAVTGGADICGVGPMFPSTTKDKPRLAGPGYLQAFLADEVTGRVPHLAIGGISPMNVQQLSAVGCRGVAVSSVVCGADNPRRVCEELVAALQPAISN
jgi:thiamine-phosphate pyrophosphorylase